MKAIRLGPRFRKALPYAAHLHRSQVRKATRVPYVAHLLAVASLVLEDGGDEDEVIAALLHDAVEDQGGKPTLRAIRARFGPRVARIVEGCTDADTVPKPPWRERKERYLARLRREPRSVLRVSAADKLHNARTLLGDYRRVGERLWARFTGGREGTLWYYRSLVRRFRARRIGFLGEELGRVVAEIERRAAARRSP